MKGKIKLRKHTKFQRGHAINKNRISKNVAKYKVSKVGKFVRLSTEEFLGSVDFDKNSGTFKMTDHKFRDTGVRVLRPKRGSLCAVDMVNKGPPAPVADDNAHVNLQKIEEMVNLVKEEHMLFDSSCLQSDLKICENIKWGITRKIKWQCLTCGFLSRKYNLYKEITQIQSTRGPKAAAVNIGLAMGITGSTIGASGVRSILHSMNTAAPARSGFKRTLDKAYDKTVDINVKDMSDRRAALINLQKQKGLPEHAPIRAEVDGRYATPLSRTGSNLMSPSTQMVVHIAEQETKSRDIISVSTFSKLCHKCKLLEKKGKNVPCPGGHSGCSRNLEYSDNIGNERRGSSACLDNMTSNKVIIGTITSDGDSSSALGIRDRQPGIPLETVRDNIHFKKSHNHNIKNNQHRFTRTMFPYKTVRTREVAIKRFREDLINRCHTEAKNAHNRYGHNMDIIKSVMPKTIDSIISCYQGDCAQCKDYSFACNGVPGSSGHWDKALMPKDLRTLKMAESDKVVLKCMIEYRLGNKGLELTKYNTDSQKAEAINRAYNKCAPKDITKSRNFKGSIHAAVFSVNNRPSNAIVRKSEAVGAAITPKSRVAEQLLADDKRLMREKARQKTTAYKQARFQSSLNKNKAFDERDGGNIQDSYQKRLYDPVLHIPDHSYVSPDVVHAYRVKTRRKMEDKPSSQSERRDVCHETEIAPLHTGRMMRIVKVHRK